MTSNFIDPTASWIWNTPAANIGGPIGIVNFGATYNNTSPLTLNATIIVMVDNLCQVFVNSTMVMNISDNSWLLPGQYGIGYAPIPPGFAKFTFAANNVYNPDNTQHNPAGLIYSVLVNGSVLFNSGSNTYTGEFWVLVPLRAD